MATTKEVRFWDLVIISGDSGWFLPLVLRQEDVNEGTWKAHMLKSIKHLCLACAQSFPFSAATMISLHVVGI